MYERSFRGIKEVEVTSIFLPTKRENTKYRQQVARLRFQARAAIEACLPFKKKPLLRIELPKRSGWRY